MIKKLFFLAVLMAPTLALGADPSTNLSVQVVPGGGGGNCTNLNPPTLGPIRSGYNCDASLSDEFNGTSLDTTKWSLVLPGQFNNYVCYTYTTNNNFISGGSFHMLVSAGGSPPAGCSFTPVINGLALELQGSNNLLLPQNYFVEARIKMPCSAYSTCSPSTGLDPGWYTLGTCPGCSSHTNNIAEVDDVEVGNSGAMICWNANYASTCAGRSGCATTPASAFDGNFHVWGRSHINGVYQWYFDGAALCSQVDPNPPIFTDNLDTFIYQNVSEFTAIVVSMLPADMQIDYIRTYHP